MGFNLTPKQENVTITINDLSSQMISDLITCYAADIPEEDVECRHLLTQRTGLNPTYPIISKEVVQTFYDELYLVKMCIQDVIVCNYHLGVEGTGDWVQGTTPTTVQSLKDTVFIIIAREFVNYGASWIFQYAQGDFNNLKPFSDAIVDQCIYFTSRGDYNNFVTLVKANYVPLVNQIG